MAGAHNITRPVMLLRRMGLPQRVLGSSYMRGEQLVAMLSPYLDGVLPLQVLPFNADLLPFSVSRLMLRRVPKDSIVIFIKSAARGLTRDHVDLLKGRGAVIGLDSIDMAVADIELDLFDFHIAASFAGQKSLQGRLKAEGRGHVPVELLLHHADPRLGAGSNQSSRPFKCGYVGLPENADIPADIASDIEMVAVKFAKDFLANLDTVRSFSLHYGVRPGVQASGDPERSFKPFTKGSTAAACRANIIVNKGVDDAVQFLGGDYPYLVGSNEPRDIVNTFFQARDEYGGATWLDGLDRMRHIQEMISPRALAERMCEIAERVSEL